MPLFINNILTDTKEESERCFADVLDILAKDGENPSGISCSEDKQIIAASYDVKDLISDTAALRILFTMRQFPDRIEVVGIHAVIPNENTIELTFEEPLDEEDEFNDCAWTVAAEEDRHTDVIPVNRHLVNNDIAGKKRVSLSGFPYEDILFAEDMKKINEASGFKPQVYPWQEAIGLGSEPISIGFDEHFVGMGVVIGKIKNYRKVHLKFYQREYDGIIMEAQTGLGDMPFLLPVRYEEEAKNSAYFRIFADINADFSCGERDYYGKEQQ